MNNQERNEKMRYDNEFFRAEKNKEIDEDFFAMCDKFTGEAGNCIDQCPMRYVPNCYSEYFYMRGYEDGQKEALEKQERCKYHDLRKNPDDLPSKDGLYWVHGKWGSGKIAEGECEYKVHDGYFSTSWNFNVIAWREIEPFEEVE